MCVCVSVKSHLTYGVRPENAVTYSAGNEGICGVFSETAPLSTPSVVRPCVQSAIFPYSRVRATRMIHRRGFSTLVLFIHAVVLRESAQRYRALMVILQSHRTQNMILRCYPNVSAILRRHTKSCLLCFFNNPYISPF